MRKVSSQLCRSLPTVFVSCFIVGCLYYRLHSTNHTHQNLESQRWRLLKLEDKYVIKDKAFPLLQNGQETEIKITESEIPAKYAYASLMAGCDPDDKKYLGYMFNAITSMEILRESGSTADFILMVRMAASTTMESLPMDEEESLCKAGIKVMYLPKPSSAHQDNYLTAQMDKFSFLRQSKKYSKVIFMDADVMPLCNLDIFFEASTSGQIERNFVIAENNTPSNGGFFMLSLEDGDYEKAYEIIKNKESPFDKEVGWGHKIDHPDYYRIKNDAKPRYLWSFNAAPADQGFLYYWVKYIKKSVTINLNADEGIFEDWSVSPNGTVVRKHNGSKNMPSCKSSVKGNRPWFNHFFRYQKPWLFLSDQALTNFKNIQSFNRVKDAKQMWWFYLLQANKLHGLNLKVDFRETRKLSNALPLGAWGPENSELVNNFHR